MIVYAKGSNASAAVWFRFPCQVRAGKAKLPQRIPNFGRAHEQFPKKTAPVVLDHRDDRPLVNCEIRSGKPIARQRECVNKAKPSSDLAMGQSQETT